MSKILVIGARGTVGSALVPLLEAAGHEVRRATRQAPQSPADLQVDVADGTGLDAAFEGVDAALLMSPPGHIDQRGVIGRQLEAARRAGTPKAVLMTAMGADADPTSPLRQAELALQQSGLAWNVIRPNWFMQNFNSYWLAGIRESSEILLPAGRAKGSFIDARDISAVAAVLLTGRQHEGREFDLTGPEALDHDQAAALISHEAGRPIRYAEVTPEAMRERLQAAGMPPDYAGMLVAILGFFKAGYAERVTDAVQQLTGQPPRSFATYAHDHRDAWR